MECNCKLLLLKLIVEEELSKVQKLIFEKSWTTSSGEEGNDQQMDENLNGVGAIREDIFKGVGTHNIWQR